MNDCKKCGTRYESTDKICIVCGAKVNRKPSKLLVIIVVLVLLAASTAAAAFVLANLVGIIQNIEF